MPTTQMAECESPEPVSLQLQWFTQAQFAGYYAAQTRASTSSTAST